MLFLQLKHTVKYIALVPCGVRCRCVDTFPSTKSISKVQYEEYKRCYDASFTKNEHAVRNEKEKDTGHWLYFIP